MQQHAVRLCGQQWPLPPPAQPTAPSAASAAVCYAPSHPALPRATHPNSMCVMNNFLINGSGDDIVQMPLTRAALKFSRCADVSVIAHALPPPSPQVQSAPHLCVTAAAAAAATAAAAAAAAAATAAAAVADNYAPPARVAAIDFDMRIQALLHHTLPHLLSANHSPSSRCAPLVFAVILSHRTALSPPLPLPFPSERARHRLVPPALPPCLHAFPPLTPTSSCALSRWTTCAACWLRGLWRRCLYPRVKEREGGAMLPAACG